MKTAVLPVMTSEFGELELLNSFFLRVFRREIREAIAMVAVAEFAADIENGVFEIRPLTTAAILRSKEITVKRTSQLGNRSSDILHVAAALSNRADSFFTFDRKQAKLASMEGLRVG